MSATPMFAAALILLPVLGLLTWVWYDLSQVDARLRLLGGFEGHHFEVGPLAAEDTAGTP